MFYYIELPGQLYSQGAYSDALTDTRRQTSCQCQQSTQVNARGSARKLGGGGIRSSTRDEIDSGADAKRVRASPHPIAQVEMTPVVKHIECNVEVGRHLTS